MTESTRLAGVCVGAGAVSSESWGAMSFCATQRVDLYDRSVVLFRNIYRLAGTTVKIIPFYRTQATAVTSPPSLITLFCIVPFRLKPPHLSDRFSHGMIIIPFWCTWYT